MSVLAAGGAAVGRLTLLADPTDVGDETHKAGPIAIVVIAVLCVACFVLFRSMSKHMRRVREQFPTDDPVQQGGTGEHADGVAAAAAPDAGSQDGAGVAPSPATAGASRPAPKSRSHTPDA